jgi:DnaJ domain
LRVNTAVFGLYKEIIDLVFAPTIACVFVQLLCRLGLDRLWRRRRIEIPAQEPAPRKSGEHEQRPTHYDTLGVAQQTPPEVVRAAYKALTQMYHPDRPSNPQRSVDRMHALSAAYAILSDPAKRKEYDTWLNTAGAKDGDTEATQIEPPDNYSWQLSRPRRCVDLPTLVANNFFWVAIALVFSGLLADALGWLGGNTYQR